MCKRCEVKDLTSIEANPFSFIENYKSSGSFPKCMKVNTGKLDVNDNPIINNNCCVIEENNTRYACPDICFDWNFSLKKNEEPKAFSPDIYMKTIQSNTNCSKINVPIVKQKAELDLSDITDELDYDANKLSDWRTDDNWAVDLKGTDQYMSDLYKN